MIKLATMATNAKKRKLVLWVTNTSNLTMLTIFCINHNILMIVIKIGIRVC